MSRIDEIFLQVRDTLNDHQKQRWSDDTLIRNLRLAIMDVAKKTHLFKEITTIPLIPGTATYKCPEGILTLSHATYDNLPLPLHSSEWMNKNFHAFWRTDTVDLTVGRLQYAIFDEVKRRQIMVYPIPSGDVIEEYISVPNEYGLIGDIEGFDQYENYGILAEIVDTDMAPPVHTSLYGVATLVGEAKGITIYYSRNPTPLPDSTDDILELDECFDPALKFFITGTCLRNDVDIQNRQMASEEFTLYNRELETIIEHAHTDSVSDPSFESHYNPMG